MTVLDTLTLALGLDTKGLDKGLTEAQRKVEAGARSLGQSLMSPIRAALGAVAAGLSLGAITKQYLGQADAIGKMADSIGADMEELQAWGEAAARAGGSAEAFNSTLQGMTRSLQMAASGAKGPAAQALQQLGVKATDASGKARDVFDVLRDMATKMEGMDKQKAMGLAQRAGIDRGTILLLQSGRAAMDDLIKRQKELGVYTKEDAEIAGKANDAIDDLGQALKSGAALIMRHVVPAIRWIADKMTEVVQFFKRHQPLVVAGLGAIATVVTARLIPALIKMGIANAKAFAPFLALAAIISAVALVVDDFWTYLHGGETAFEGLWKKLGTGPELLEKLTKAWETTKQVASAFFTALEPYLENIIKLIGAFVAAWAFGKVIAGLSNMIGTIMGIGKAIRGIGAIVAANPLGLFLTVLSLIIIYWDDIIAISQKFFDNLGKWAADAGKWLSGIWTDFLNKTKQIWNDIKTSIDQKWEEIKESASTMWEGIKTTASNTWDNIKTAVTTKMTELWESLKAIFTWDTWKTAFSNIFHINFDEIGQKIAKIFSWDAWKQAFANIFGFNFSDLGNEIAKIFSWEEWKTRFSAIFSINFAELGQKIAGLFSWETWKTAFSDIFNINFAELGQKIAKIFSWDEWKKAFADIFDFNFDWEKLKNDIIKGFQQAWEWIKANFPPARWLAGMGDKAEQAEKSQQENNELVTDPSNYGAENYSDPRAIYKNVPPAPTPAEGVSSQAAAAATTNNVSNNLTQNDSRSTTVNIYANTDNPQALGNAAAKALDKRPQWATQTATSIMQGGA